MQKAGWLRAVFICAILVGCPDGNEDGNSVVDDAATGGNTDEDQGEATGTPDDVTGDVDKKDGGTPGPTADPDAKKDSIAEEDGAQQCGEFSDPCTSNADCCSEFCVETFNGFQCTITCIDACPDGFECKVVLNTFPDVATICVPNNSKLCHECDIDLQCNGGKCIDIGGSKACTVDCSQEECPTGYNCAAQEDGSEQCMPENGSCDCDLNNEGAVRPCGNQNEYGACTGVETCVPDVGWSSCDAATPDEEVCDGVDNDCDGLADEDFGDTKVCEIDSEFGTCVGIASCQGPNGWVCSASQPTEEQCDFLDNDCDGTVDENFKSANGKYGTTEHCGGCGKDCTGLFPNGSATCDDTKTVPQCVVDECDDGFYQSGDYQCLPESNSTCQPCTADFQCGGGVCVTIGGTGNCAKPCGVGEECGVGFLCLAAESPADGAPKGMACKPVSGACDCIPKLDGQKKPCTAQNEVGECFGFETCDGAVGWGACAAPVPSVEICDGKDNDCNGLVDDGLPDTKACENTWPGVGTCVGVAQCFGSAGWVCNAPTPLVEVCDFKDNNCDGGIDEPFKNVDGLYASDKHCGACGTACSNAIPNATAVCSTEQGGGTPLCIVLECAEGFYQVNPFLCLKAGLSQCNVCTTDGQCDGKECVQVEESLFCADGCTGDGDCDDGFKCTSTPDPDTGQNGDFCIPDNGTCDCNSDSDGAKRPCEISNDVGTCVGFEVCNAASGWGTCSASQAEGEICDGIDNNCNGKIDDGLVATKACQNENAVGICTGQAACLGSQGWVCDASEPKPELCDYVDNDCDGNVDEDFKDDAGKYGSEAHCGSCNAACGDTIPNAKAEICDASKAKPQCVVLECEDSFYKLNDFQCIDQPDVACLPCETDAQCFGGSCADLGDSKACVAPCVTDNECSSGFVCDGSFCLPKSGSCDCTQATEGVKKFCSKQTEFGTCVGFETCNPAIGWTSCDATIPALEICDGIDNDCNGVPDDGLPASELCELENEFGTCEGNSICQGSLGWVCQAQKPAAESCDFLDNDCDGAADEDFKNEEGKYASLFHCGTCNKGCGGTIAYAAKEVCDASKDVPVCVVTACQLGYFLKNEFQCVPNPAVGCSPCVADDTCFGGKCEAVGDGNYCLEPCAGQPCKSGFTCFNGFCAPENGTCDCTDATAGQKRTCTVANDLGTCLGLETCDPSVGWTGCTAARAEEEVCDGKDNECNGLIDDALEQNKVCFNKNVYGVCDGLAACLGASGWVCNAPEPEPETCDFKDNDCDGEVDEDYKDETGKYTTAQHCGTCGNECGDQYPHSLTEVCDPVGVPQCVVNECEDGYLKLNDFQCLEIPDVVCSPCASDANCFGATCAQVDKGNFCLTACQAGQCGDGFFCSEGLCRPSNGTCDCNEDTKGSKRTCNINNELGLCYGFETCEPATGWGGCDAVAAQDELCDGQDNDCNGFIDDGLPQAQDCEAKNAFGTCLGTASCFGTVGWFCKAPIPQAEVCDFLDNDCDGSIDEEYKDVLGKYSSNEHCGGCNNNCDGAILNADSICDGAKDVPQCVVEDCGIGWEKYNEYLCIPITSALCEACEVDDNCIAEGAKCVQLNEGKFCGIACDIDDDCPAAYNCLDPGVGEKQCVPATGSCDCDGSNLELQKACKEEFTAEGGGPTQVCFGTNFCTADGWTGCTLPTEFCNNLDDDCDGEIDEIYKNGEGKYASVEHCGKCNRNCAELDFDNAVGICDTALLVPDCSFQCIGGFFDVNENPADGCECEFVSNTDFPDGTDWNCDGIDGELDNAVFVAKNGSDQNPGTKDLPMLTIQAAANKAVADGKRDVYVNTSVYSENVLVPAGVSIYGGYSADFGQRNTVLYETAIIGVEPTGQKVAAITVLDVNGAGQKTIVDGFTVFGHSSSTPGESSYAVYARDGDKRLEIRNNRILSGNGGNGAQGGKGVDGGDGDGGIGGSKAKDLGNCTINAFVEAGGAGGQNSCGTNTSTNGGDGGDGYCPNYTTSAQNGNEAGKAGANGGGAGGGHGYDTFMGGQFQNCHGWVSPAGCGTCYIPPNNLPMSGAEGKDGPDGASGSAGQGCTNPAGVMENGLWKAGLGLNGSSGASGGGGGGGGAGNGVMTCSCSAYGGDDMGGLGGGGGAGGCASTGGTLGSGGGGSFGIFLYYSASPASAPIVKDNEIRRGGGGIGGPGGNAGVGGKGGVGGPGGDEGTGTTATFCAGKGGKGGKGGNGGHGGGGGGGCGGSSYAIYAVGQGGAVNFASIKSGNTFLAGGQGGSGGQGGLSLGNTGGTGSAGAYLETNF